MAHRRGLLTCADVFVVCAAVMWTAVSAIKCYDNAMKEVDCDDPPGVLNNNDSDRFNCTSDTFFPCDRLTLPSIYDACRKQVTKLSVSGTGSVSLLSSF